MNYSILFSVIFICTILIGFLVFSLVMIAADITRSEVLEETENRTLSDPSITKSIVRLGIPAYGSFNHSCNMNFTDDAYMSLYLQYPDVPRDCSIFINEKYTKVLRNLKPDCVRECPYEEFAITAHLGQLDVRETHAIRVCCNGICVEEFLPRLCKFSN